MGSDDAVFKRSFRDGLDVTMIGFAAGGLPVGKLWEESGEPSEWQACVNELKSHLG